MKKNLDIVVINLLTVILGIIFYLCFGYKVEILAAIIAIGISLSLGLRQYEMENDRIFKELFIAFNEKYDTKFNGRLNEIDEKYKKENDYALTSIEISLVIDYFNLCAEEYLWYTKKRIPKIVWNSWENGMVYYLNIKPINDILIMEKNQPDSYYGLFSKIGGRLKNWK
jgi:hypothetical protein